MNPGNQKKSENQRDLIQTCTNPLRGLVVLRGTLPSLVSRIRGSRDEEQLPRQIRRNGSSPAFR